MSDVEQDLQRYLANARLLEKAHAYSPADEHDACGVGLVASVDGNPRRDVVVNAVVILDMFARAVPFAIEDGLNELRAMYGGPTLDNDG